MLVRQRVWPSTGNRAGRFLNISAMYVWLLFFRCLPGELHHIGCHTIIISIATGNTPAKVWWEPTLSVALPAVLQAFDRTQNVLKIRNFWQESFGTALSATVG